MTPAKPWPLLMPVTSTRSPAANTSALRIWPSSKPDEVDDPQLGQVLRRVGVRRLQVTELGLGEPLRLGFAEGELDRGIPVTLGSLDLDHTTGPGLDDGDRNDPVSLVEDLGHAELSAQDPFVRHCRLR